MDKMKENTLVLKSINQLLEYSFFIPSYQRGYRWSNTQVTQLLDDIWDFAINPPVHDQGKAKPFYCLQPIVVKQHGDDENEWEVIDGQQRLTTILLILKNLEFQIERDLKNFKRLYYETRKESESFLKNIDAALADKNIDFSHIAKANNTIQEWFKNKANNTEYSTPKAKLAPTFLTDTKVIWYVVNESSSSSIDIFTRLNIGKIPLTNAELVKALFLQKGNFDENKASLKQLQIASEWDIIEKKLQDNKFWYFIYNLSNPIKYDNRIEYIFDLMKDKSKDDETYFTFYKFHDDFIKNKKQNGKPDIDELWLKIKRYYLSFEEWYNNRKLYHLIGFLVDCGDNIRNLKWKSEKKTKTEFKNYIKDEIRSHVDFQVDLLNYPDNNIRKVLLLFNIQTILATENADIRFPFFRYKTENWDIEHIRSQTEKNITGDERSNWAIDVLEYFTGEKGYSDNLLNGSKKSEKEIQQEIVETLEQKEKLFSQGLLEILDAKKIEDDVFDKIYEELTLYFEESEEPENIDSVSNLALLDAKTNRSYKNAMFPIKRKTIIYNDMNGIFVPICTKNVFLKSYTKKMGKLMYWKDSDAQEYLHTIKKTLIEYLPLQNGSNDK